MKPLLTAEELVSHMMKKGIRFDLITKEEAINFLKNRNYYMKLASYRFNYQKHTTGKNKGMYINLDFAYLKELSTIDMHLRYTVLQMCLDIEHYMKVKLLKLIEDNPEEDGYQIVQRYIAKNTRLQSLLTIQQHKTSEYSRRLIDKYYPYFPVWVFVEVISFGELTHLCSYYEDLYHVQIINHSLLNSVRDLRNASAHNNCLINHLYIGDFIPDPNIVRMVNQLSIAGKTSVRKKMKSKIINDFVCLLMAYNTIVTSPITKQQRYMELHELFDERFVRGENREWFKTNSIIASSYSFIKKMLDSMCPK